MNWYELSNEFMLETTRMATEQYFSLRVDGADVGRQFYLDLLLAMTMGAEMN